MIDLVLESKNVESDDKIKYSIFYFTSKVKTITNENNKVRMIDCLERHVIVNL